MFVGHKLKHLRLLKEWSLSDVGEYLGISEQAVWQFEQQVIEPKFLHVIELSKLFHVKASYFLDKAVVAQCFSSPKLSYSTSTKLSQKKIDHEIHYLNNAHAIIQYLEGNLIAPKFKIYELKDEIIKTYGRYKSYDKVTIQDIATFARQFLELKDNRSLLQLLELSGVYILEKPLESGLDAYSIWSNENHPYIVLSKKTTAVRRTFSLAHELGHLLMHFDIDILNLDKEDYSTIENEANLFALFFLMPEEEIIEDFKGIKKYSNPDSYISLKSKYFVSLQALGIRAHKLGYLNASQNNYFYRQIHGKNYAKKEPLDDEFKVKVPGKIRYLFDFVIKQNVLTLDDITENFKVSLQFLSDLLSIDMTFFERYTHQVKQEPMIYQLKK